MTTTSASRPIGIPNSRLSQIMDHSATRFGQLSIEGFRRLRDVRLALRPLSVMIGANGTGKTSVLDVLSLLASSAQVRLGPSISELGGLANVLTYDKAEKLGLGITMEVPGHQPLEYSLSLRPQGIAYAIGEEMLQNWGPPAPLFQFVWARQAFGYFDREKKNPLPPTGNHTPL